MSLRQDGQDYSYLYDGKGNVISVIDSSQSPVAGYHYDAFGKLMAESGTLDQPFMFSTKRYDAGTGLSYYGYRHYSAVIGRWITRDPIGEAGGINLYGFVQNDPVNMIDPFGLAPIISTRPQGNQDSEWGGWIYSYKTTSEDMRYSYTEPVAGESNILDSSKFNEPCPGQRKEAVYHTHPGTGYNVKIFSNDDYLWAAFNGYPYLYGNKFWSSHEI